MSPELIVAIKERIEAGHSKEQIKAEVLSIGYTEVVFEEAYQTASSGGADQVMVSSTIAVGAFGNTGLISYSDFMRATWELAREQINLFLKILGINVLITLLFGASLLAVFGEISAEVAGGGEEFVIWIMVAVFMLTAMWLLSSLILIRALLKRHEGQTLMSHFNWSVRHSVGLVAISLMMMVLVWLGFVLFVIPGIMLILYLFFTLFFYLDDRAYGVNSLVMSTKYTYGRFWALVGRIMLLSIVLYVITMAGAMLSMFTLILAPIFIVIVMFASYYLSYCGYVVLYESVLKSGVARALPISDTTLNATYKWTTIIITLIVLGFFFVGFASFFYFF